MCSGNAESSEDVKCSAIGGVYIAASASTTGATEAACCGVTGLCSGNTNSTEDVVCSAAGGALGDSAGVTVGATEEMCCLVSGMCQRNTDTTTDVECFHFGTSLYDDVTLMGQNESTCCDAGIGALFFSLFLVLIAMYIIAFACDSFEPAADYLGTEVYKMGPGIRGASIEAVASSLPELFTTLFLLFAHNDQDGFSAGIATCAGSALFNGAVIPAICILAVSIKGVDGEKVDRVALSRAVLVRDGSFFLAAEIVLIFFLSSPTLKWWMGLALMFIYVIYAFILIQGVGVEEDDEDDDDGGDGEDLDLDDRVKGDKDDDDDEEKADHTGIVQNPMKDVVSGSTTSDATGDDDDDDGPSSMGMACVTFDTNYLIYSGADYNPSSAWVNLLACTLIIAVACYVLAESVMLSARALGVAPYFTAVILGAAASSVPDTIISYKDALKGDYDDAVANAIGSNIFDICFALGFPLFLYGLIHGDVQLTGSHTTNPRHNSIPSCQRRSLTVDLT